MSNEKTYVELALTGDVDLEGIDDFVDRWHESNDTHRTLGEYLGFRDDEYTLWVERPEALRFILHSRQFNVPLEQLATQGAEESELALAARTSDLQELAEIRQWILKRKNPS